MKLWAVLAVAVLAAGADRMEVFGVKWSAPNAADWKIDSDSGTPMLRLVTGHEPLPGPRRPFQFVLAETTPLERVKLTADLRPQKRSLMLVFAYRDAAHFDYAHLSTDTGTKQPVHNGIFHVYGGERVRISAESGPPAFGALNQWYHVVLTYDGKSGDVSVTVDGKAVPALHAVDVSLGAGQVGIGSFDETGDFKNVKIDWE